MDTATVYVSLNAALAVAALVLAWVAVIALRIWAPVSRGYPTHGHDGARPLTLGELLWILGLMLTFYWLGVQFGYLLLGIG